jgi:two-component system sensor kinase FixL
MAQQPLEARLTDVIPAPARTATPGISAEILIDAITDVGLIVLDPEGHVTSWNSGAERIKGWRADEIVGQPFSVFFRPEDAAAGAPARELAVARDTGRYEDQVVRVRKDGSTFVANVSLTPLRDEAGGCGASPRSPAT